MAIGKLYISHLKFDFSKLNSEWLTKKNLKKVLESDELKDYHTTLEDCGVKIGQIKNLLSSCQSIEILDITWDTVVNNDNHMLYLRLAHLLMTDYKDISFGADQLYNEIKWHSTYLRAKKQTKKNSLWVAGCSWSSADGVESQQRWGHLVANKIGLEEINLAISGGSIFDAADQILRSDIKKGDIVTWGLTSPGRIDYIDQSGKLQSTVGHQAVLESTFNKFFKPDYLFSTTQSLISLRQIRQVINYCKKIQADLYLINFLDQTWIPFGLSQEKNFLNIKSNFDDKKFAEILIDYGTDGVHPGPLQHKEFAKEIIKCIQGAENYGRNERVKRVGWQQSY